MWNAAVVGNRAEYETRYAALVRLQERGWIRTSWGTSDNNRRAKYYALTQRGRKQLETETANWHKLASVMGRIFGQEDA